MNQEKERVRTYLFLIVRIVTTTAKSHPKAEVETEPTSSLLAGAAVSSLGWLSTVIWGLVAENFALSLIVKPSYTFSKQPSICLIFFSVCISESTFVGKKGSGNMVAA